MPDISLSSSAYRDASNCLKRYQYRWLDNLVPIPRDQKPALRRGIWLHRTLELIDRGESWDTELQRMAAWALDQGVEEQKVNDLVGEVADITRQYTAFWDEKWAQNQWYLEDTEKVVAFSPTPGVKLTATVDVLKRDQQGRLWIWERKTLAEIPDSDWRCVDPQTMLQMVLLRTQEPVQGVVFDYVCTKNPPRLRVKKGGLLYSGDDERQTTALRLAEALPEIKAKWEPNLNFESPEAYVRWLYGRVVNDAAWFQRYPTLRDNEHLVENMRDVADTTRNIIAAHHRGHFPRAWNPLTCPLFCPYMRLCANEFQTGHRNEMMRRENFTEATQEMWDQGRSA
ncbi:MAG TPA: PD-(D/E)XK nuclease family protein [Chloroflexota bacterium]